MRDTPPLRLISCGEWTGITEVVEVVERPAEPTSNRVMTGFYTFTPANFHASHLVQPPDRGEYELPDAIDLPIQFGRTIDAIRLDGWQ